MLIIYKTIGQHYYQLHSLYTIQHHKKELVCHYLRQIMGMTQ